MATSAALSTSNSNIKYKITITQNSQSVSNNTSNVTVSVNVYRTNTGYTTYGTGTIYCKIDGTTYSASITSDDKITSSGITLFSKTLTIEHNADGTKTLATSAWIDHSQFSSSAQSYSQKLTTIPRATTPTVSSTSVNLGSSVTITMDRASSSFDHTLRYSFAGSSGTIGSDIGTSKEWTVPLSLADKIPKATSGSLIIYCDTYNGSTKIGTKSVTITVKVPSSVVPTISSVALSEATSGLAAKFGAYVQNKSTLKVVISAAGAYSSTITSYSTKILNKTYTGSTFTSGVLTSSGSVSVAVTVKDSRGRTATKTATVTVLAYVNPEIHSFSAKRCNSDGSTNLEGEYVKLAYAFDISSLSNKNDKTYTISYKLQSATSYTTLTSGEVYSADTELIPTTVFNGDNSYHIKLAISDYFKTVSYIVEVSTAFTLMDFHYSGQGIAFGKVAETEGIADFGMRAVFRNGENPQGAIALNSGDDLDDYTEPGYYVFSADVSSTLLNSPLGGKSSGSMEVIREGNSTQVRQVITRCSVSAREIWERLYYSNTWQEWLCIYKGGTTSRILWSGGYLMTAGHTATLTEKISKQPNGIVLVFSRYSAATIRDYHFNSFFIHKAFVAAMPGCGNTFMMTTDGSFSVMATKYVYIHDDKIVGNEINGQTGTGTSGIVYENNGFVLRYVIGV